MYKIRDFSEHIKNTLQFFFSQVTFPKYFSERKERSFFYVYIHL